MRGEYGLVPRKPDKEGELPPRARRILSTYIVVMLEIVNYLRVRGEYGKSLVVACKIRELPPRARRIHIEYLRHYLPPGTTSACAENTAENPTSSIQNWNYLRVRGEYYSTTGDGSVWLELPPRARRIRGCGSRHQCSMGTTSACAENTQD